MSLRFSNLKEVYVCSVKFTKNWSDWSICPLNIPNHTLSCWFGLGLPNLIFSQTRLKVTRNVPFQETNIPSHTLQYTPPNFHTEPKIWMNSYILSIYLYIYILIDCASSESSKKLHFRVSICNFTGVYTLVLALLPKKWASGWYPAIGVCIASSSSTPLGGSPQECMENPILHVMKPGFFGSGSDDVGQIFVHQP